jgi:hypothetical protein
MKRGLAIGITLLLGAAAEAADPPKPARAPAANQKPALAKPLNLKIGDVRKYMSRKDYLLAISAPDEDKQTVVVEGARDPEFRLQSEKPIPAGFPPLTLWWALRHPANSWRILAPDVNAPVAGPVYDVVPPPIFRWGP